MCVISIFTQNGKFMKKLLLSALAFSCLSAPALAQDKKSYEFDSLSNLSGIYVGAFAGYGWNDVDGPAGINPDVNGGDYGIFVGYKADALLDQTINRVGLGLNGAIEVHYAVSGADDEIGTADFEKKDEFGISFRPGMSFLGDDLPLGLNPYGIIGYRRAEFEVEAGGVSFDEDFNGFELGIGTELVGYGNYGIRLDYSHVWYGEESNFDPDLDELRLGVAYHF